MFNEPTNFGEEGLKKLIGEPVYCSLNIENINEKIIGSVSFLETKVGADLYEIGKITKILYEDNKAFDFPKKDQTGNPDYRTYELALENVEKENNEVILKGFIKHIDWLNLRKTFAPISSKVKIYITEIPEIVTGYHSKLKE